MKLSQKRLMIKSSPGHSDADYFMSKGPISGIQPREGNKKEILWTLYIFLHHRYIYFYNKCKTSQDFKLQGASHFSKLHTH